MRKHSLISYGVCPSICLSRSCVVSRRPKITSDFSLHPVPRHSIFIFLTQIAGPQFPQETPSAWVQNTCGVWKFAISSEIADHFRNGTRQVYGCYESLIRSRRRCIDPCRFRWLSVTWKSWTRGSKFLGGSPYDNTVWRRVTKFTR